MSETAFSPQSVLVTGGAGFIGSNFVKFVLGQSVASAPRGRREGAERHSLERRPPLTSLRDVKGRRGGDATNANGVHGVTITDRGPKVVNLDCLTYAGNLENLADVADDPRYAFAKVDICDTEEVLRVCQEHAVDCIVHFAAESHVDRSIIGPAAFIRTNVNGALSLLQVARQCGDLRFLQVSTDEVYGSLGPTGYFTEETALDPHSPYSASKAAADHLVSAFRHTYGLPTLITRCSNNYGPYQFPEKMIPLMINNARHDKPLPVYGDGLNVRDWLYVEDHCRAIWTVLTRGQPGRVYNIGGNSEKTNLEVVKTLLRNLDKPESLITFVKDRPGHDRRYAIDATRIRTELGWSPSVDFDAGLARTIDWYLNNQPWLDRIVSGEYQTYYEEMYAGR